MPTRMVSIFSMDVLEVELLQALSSCVSCSELSEFNRMLIRASAQIEDRLAQSIQGNDEDLARQLQEQMNQESTEKFDEDERLLQEFLRRDRTCEFCQTEFPAESPPHVLVSCEHHICQNCALQQIVVRNSPVKQADYVCPLAQCASMLTEVDIRALLPSNEVEKYIDAALNDLGSSVVKCPTGCGWAVTVDLSGTVSDGNLSGSNQGETGIDGRPLTIEARRHRDQYRIRCRRCPDTDFCAECLATPYHLGFTCLAHEHFKKQRHCRFCGAQVAVDAPWILNLSAKGHVKDLEAVLKARLVLFKPKSKIEALSALLEDSEPLADLCGSEECQQWAREGCGKVLACRHVCLGLRGELCCLGCLQCEPDGNSARADDFCNICWTTELKSAPCLRLDCGHVFHRHCVVHKVQSRWCGARITFGFLDCPLCKQPLAAPALTALLAPHLALRQAVLGRAEQRLGLEGGHGSAPELAVGGRYHGQPGLYAMHKFAYYICSRCGQPYFGGQRSCEVAAGEGEAAAFDASEMVCGGCSAQGKASCDRHGLEAIEYKCKFCCAVASWFCWGTTHFCDDCHRKQGTTESMSKKPRNQLPTCTPATCPLGVAHPPNGEEFVLGCQLCRSASSV